MTNPDVSDMESLHEVQRERDLLKSAIRHHMSQFAYDGIVGRPTHDPFTEAPQRDRDLWAVIYPDEVFPPFSH